MAQSYKELIAWRKAMDLVVEVYRVTRSFPGDELYGLTSQLRRAAVSVPSNIAEGQARYSRREFCHFLTIARGSLAEIETQVRIAARARLCQRRNRSRSAGSDIGTRSNRERLDRLDKVSGIEEAPGLCSEYRVPSTGY